MSLWCEKQQRFRFITRRFLYHNPTKKKKNLLDVSMKESKKQKDERTPSEKLQDDLEILWHKNYSTRTMMEYGKE